MGHPVVHVVHMNKIKSWQVKYLILIFYESVLKDRNLSVVNLGDQALIDSYADQQIVLSPLRYPVVVIPCRDN